MNSIWPCKAFWNTWIKKFFSLLISVKMLIIELSYLALKQKLISGDNFERIIIAVAVAKLSADMVSIYKGKDQENEE